MEIINVSAGSGSYDVLVGAGLLERAGELTRGVVKAAKSKSVVIVTDTNIASLYLERVAEAYRQAGFIVGTAVLDAGEAGKSMEGLQQLYAAFSKNGVTRSDVIAALGGGVVGDVAGFAAATWMRGVSCVQLPTTLLSQADASVGGKTAINLPQGKNLAGTFTQPILVLDDTDVLAGLPKREFACGLAEVIKYGMIADAEILEKLDTMQVGEMVSRCARIKAGLVERDEHDTGAREILNFGHTIGHAVEAAGGFARYNHGEGVAVGMVMATRLGEKLGFTPLNTDKMVSELLGKHGLPTSVPYDAEELLKFILMDKKRVPDGMRMTFPTKTGHVEPFTVAIETLLALLPGALKGC